LFLGYGLVSVPKALWHKANLQRSFNYCLFRIDLAEEKRQIANMHLKENSEQVASIKHYNLISAKYS
jgi:hypothetical protein